MTQTDRETTGVTPRVGRSTRRLTRRSFLRMSAMVGVGTLVSACGYKPQVPPAGTPGNPQDVDAIVPALPTETLTPAPPDSPSAEPPAAIVDDDDLSSQGVITLYGELRDIADEPPTNVDPAWGVEGLLRMLNDRFEPNADVALLPSIDSEGRLTLLEPDPEERPEGLKIRDTVTGRVYRVEEEGFRIFPTASTFVVGAALIHTAGALPSRTGFEIRATSTLRGSFQVIAYYEVDDSYVITYQADLHGNWVALDEAIVVTSRETIFTDRTRSTVERQMVESELFVEISGNTYPELADRFGELGLSIYLSQGFIDSWDNMGRTLEPVVLDAHRMMMFTAAILQRQKINNDDPVNPSLDEFITELGQGQVDFKVAAFLPGNNNLPEEVEMNINNIKVLMLPNQARLGSLESEIATNIYSGPRGQEVRIGFHVDPYSQEENNTLFVVIKLENKFEEYVHRSSAEHLLPNRMVSSVFALALPRSEIIRPSHGTQFHECWQKGDSEKRTIDPIYSYWTGAPTMDDPIELALETRSTRK